MATTVLSLSRSPRVTSGKLTSSKHVWRAFWLDRFLSTRFLFNQVFISCSKMLIFQYPVGGEENFKKKEEFSKVIMHLIQTEVFKQNFLRRRQLVNYRRGWGWVTNINSIMDGIKSVKFINNICKLFIRIVSSILYKQDRQYIFEFQEMDWLHRFGCPEMERIHRFGRQEMDWLHSFGWQEMDWIHGFGRQLLREFFSFLHFPPLSLSQKYFPLCFSWWLGTTL